MSRLVIDLPPGPAYARAITDAWDRGQVFVPLDRRHTDAERSQRLAGAALRLDEGGIHELAPPYEEDPPGTAMVVHTSGTTSAPKPVVLSRDLVERNTRGVAAALELTGDDLWLCPMPLSHVGGLMIPLRCHLLGARYAIQRFDPAATRDALQDATVVSFVPTMLIRLLDAGLREPPRLKVAMLGGGPVAPALLGRARAAGVPAVETYGLTEACSTVTIDGRPIPGIAVTTEPDGEIVVDGTLRTGDLGAWDDDGRLRIIGRKADTIVSGGENVAPAEVEAVLLAHPAIADAGVFPRHDPEWGEAVHAALVLRVGRPRPSDDELRNLCRERLARFKVPKAFEWRDRLPRNVNGKLVRSELS